MYGVKPLINFFKVLFLLNLWVFLVIFFITCLFYSEMYMIPLRSVKISWDV